MFLSLNYATRPVLQSQFWNKNSCVQVLQWLLQTLLCSRKYLIYTHTHPLFLPSNQAGVTISITSVRTSREFHRSLLIHIETLTDFCSPPFFSF